jgi:pyruvate/2-oxoglutarate/acetoin dehydrogenase E1 component
MSLSTVTRRWPFGIIGLFAIAQILTRRLPSPLLDRPSNAGVYFCIVGEVEFRTAIRDGLDEELERDTRVVFFGEDVAAPGGVFAVTPGLLEKHGPERVFDTPISELALAGAAFGSAVAGLRPVVEIMFADFLPLVMDSLINQATKYWYISNEQASVPLVIRSACGAGGRFGAIHSQMPVSWLLGVPGLVIVCPATPRDAKGLLKASIRNDNPVLFLEHKRLYSITGDVGDDPIQLGEASVVREGSDLTIVAAMKSVHDALEAASSLATTHGIEATVIDLRTLRPLDVISVLRSVEQTGRLLVVEEGPETGGWAGELMARVTESALGQLDAAWRLTTADLPIPYSPPLEDAFLPGADAIVRSVLERLQGAPAF